MKDKLISIWKNYSVDMMNAAFVHYAKKNGFRKWDGRRKDNSNTYYISDNENRATCQIIVGNQIRGKQPDIEIVLRKQAGDYFIISFDGIRAFEVDYRGIIDFDEKLLINHIKELEDMFGVVLSD